MLTHNEVVALREKLIGQKNEDGLALLITLEQMIAESYEYKQTVLKKVASLEKDMERLVEENQRQIRERESAFMELDTCVSFIAKLATKLGMVAGTVENKVVVELSNGQVCWEFAESEAHLFEELPAYTKAIEEIDIVEKYRRVMNAGIL